MHLDDPDVDLGHGYDWYIGLGVQVAIVGTCKSMGTNLRWWHDDSRKDTSWCTPGPQRTRVSIEEPGPQPSHWYSSILSILMSTVNHQPSDSLSSYLWPMSHKWPLNVRMSHPVSSSHDWPAFGVPVIASTSTELPEKSYHSNLNQDDDIDLFGVNMA